MPEIDPRDCQNGLADTEDATKTGKWLWKMRYCRKRRIPPAQTWAWDIAEAAYLTYLKRKNDENNQRKTNRA